MDGWVKQALCSPLNFLCKSLRIVQGAGPEHKKHALDYCLGIPLAEKHFRCMLVLKFEADGRESCCKLWDKLRK